MQYNLMLCWFIGLGIDDPVRVPTVFTKNRGRLLTTDMSRKVMAQILAHREVAPLVSIARQGIAQQCPERGDAHVSVDGTLVKAWAAMKSFDPRSEAAPPDDDPGSPPGANATTQDQSRPTETETDPMPHPTRRSRNADVDFRGEKRCNATHAPTTDPDARLCKKSPGTGAALCFTGHALMDEAGSAIGPRNPPQGSG